MLAWRVLFSSPSGGSQTRSDLTVTVVSDPGLCSALQRASTHTASLWNASPYSEAGRRRGCEISSKTESTVGRWGLHSSRTPTPPCHLFSAPPLLAEGPSKGRVRDLRTLAGRVPFTYLLGGTEAATHGAGGLADQERGRSQLRPQGREKGLTSSERECSRRPGMGGTKRRRCLRLASFQCICSVQVLSEL